LWKFPSEFSTFTLYRDDLSKVAPQAVLAVFRHQFEVDGMDLVLVDDVLYTVRTIRAAMNGLFDLAGQTSFALRPDDRGHREMPIESAIRRPHGANQRYRIVEVRLREIDK